MGFIYIIKNDINDKVYIGKTLCSQEKRFKEHCADSKRSRCEARPLYRAMNKYGSEHFFISLIEECSDSQLEEREVFWIKHYGSYHKGYNATKGGDGKAYLDQPKSKICAIYLSGITIQRIAARFGCDPGTIKKILKENHIEIRGTHTYDVGQKLKRSVVKYDLSTGETLKIYPSIKEAELDLGDKPSKHISAVCRGTRKSAHGFGWRYENN